MNISRDDFRDFVSLQAQAEYCPAHGDYPAHWIVHISGPAFVAEELSRGVSLASSTHNGNRTTGVTIYVGRYAKERDKLHADALACAQARAAFMPGVP